MGRFGGPKLRVFDWQLEANFAASLTAGLGLTQDGLITFECHR